MRVLLVHIPLRWFFLLYEECSNASCTLILIHVQMVFFGNAYFAGRSLLEKSFSKYFKYWYTSSKLLTVSFVWPRPCCGNAQKKNEFLYIKWRRKNKAFRLFVWIFLFLSNFSILEFHFYYFLCSNKCRNKHEVQPA